MSYEGEFVTAKAAQHPLPLPTASLDSGPPTPPMDLQARDAYERMLLNAARGDQSLSVSAAELHESWRIFTPLLQQLDELKPSPVVHPFGANAPDGYSVWASEHGVDIAPPPCHWGAEVALARLRQDVEADNAARAAAKAAEETAKAAEDLMFGY